MKVAVLKEIQPQERRVALTPDACARLIKSGLTVEVQASAGLESGYPDDQYGKSGAAIVTDLRNLYASADIVVRAALPTDHPELHSHEIDLLKSGALWIGFLDPLIKFDLVKRLADKGVTGVSMELIPRITRAQSMDALSSMANIAGYKAVLLAAARLPKMFPMMMTAAGTISPAKVLVIGAGVAGLQAIATAKRLGAVVSGYDVRPAVKEQVESLGAKFVELKLETTGAEDKGGYAKEQGEEFLRKQREAMAKVVADNDVVITTAAIPGKKSPVIVTTDMVHQMAAGSVIVDLAAERGGNCELTRVDEEVVDHNVTIIGPSNLPATVGFHASQMYARNLATLIGHLVKDGAFNLDFEDEITSGCVVTHDGKIVNPRIRELMGLPPDSKPGDPPQDSKPSDSQPGESAGEQEAQSGAAEGGAN